ncbi:MAG TPA: peptidoglycan DD-metalloendopeptidase family protein [Rubrivivax sp.]|nr:peptidoglycan DD-metalloendopeptidase family protein [Burkholderiales bacterium]HNT38141.1 peptidoglycan DD-metalloendopeptidase family protein [Rubrivivax sp.]
MRPSGSGRAFEVRGLCLLVTVALLAGCAGSLNQAPVEERKPPPRSTTMRPAGGEAADPVAQPADAEKTLPGAENAGKPGYYTVKPGDTLIRIALDNGQNWRDLQRWNRLENPHVIEVGQVLRVAPPGAEPALVTAAATESGSAVVKPVPAPGRMESRPLDAPREPVAAPASAPPAAAQGAAAASASPAAANKPPAREGDEAVSWMWPAAGPVVAPFEEGRNKGLAIGGKAGDAVLAAADGRVVYAGSGLRGYGNLVIVKHNATYLSAYAHNQVLLVKDEQVVRRGQKIAEMGSSDAERVQLHFEIRRLGVPVDPLRLLPAR